MRSSFCGFTNRKVRKYFAFALSLLAIPAMLQAKPEMVNGQKASSASGGVADHYSVDNTQMISYGNGTSVDYAQQSGFNTDGTSMVTNACAYYKGAGSTDICKNPSQGAAQFEAAAKTFGIPATFLACMTGHESGFKAQKGTDKAGSSGLTQFSKDTAPTFVQKFSSNKNSFQDAWKTYQNNCGTSRDKSAFTADALRSTDSKDADVQIFGIGMYLRDALANVPKKTKLSDKASSTDILHYLIVSYNVGEKAGADFMNNGFKVDGLNATTKSYIQDADKCVAAANGDTKKNQKQASHPKKTGGASDGAKACPTGKTSAANNGNGNGGGSSGGNDSPSTPATSQSPTPQAPAAAPSSATATAPKPAPPPAPAAPPIDTNPATSVSARFSKKANAAASASSTDQAQQAADAQKAQADAVAQKKAAISAAKIASATAASKKEAARRKRQEMIDNGVDPDAVSSSSNSGEMTTGQ